MYKNRESGNKTFLSFGNDLVFLAGFALLKIIIHIPFLTKYGYHSDELYFIACGQHFSAGYVDHPPFVPWIAKLSIFLFGQSIFALRSFALIAGASAVFFTGLLVKRMGGGRFAQSMACVAMIIAPVFLRTGNMLAISSFEPLFWILGFYLLIRIIQEENPKLWMGVGLVAGIGLMNKHSMLFFAFGLVVGLALTPMRKYFRSPWLYAGGALAFLIFLPNLIWQATHGWATLSFMLNLNEGVMSGISVLQFLAGQILYLHPLNTVIWISGLIYFFKKSGKRYRLLGWIWLIVFLLLVFIKSKIYYLAPAYPALITGGCIALESRILSGGRKWLKPFSMSVLIIFGSSLVPVSLPVMDINTQERYINAISLNAFKNIHELTGDLRSMFGWEERVKAVARVYHSLPEEERKRTIILANGYGNAGAVDLYGKKYGLPHASSLTLSYWLWGFPEGPVDIVIGMGFRKESLEKAFKKVDIAAVITLENVNTWDRKFTILLCREPVSSLERIWKLNRPW